MDERRDNVIYIDRYRKVPIQPRVDAMPLRILLGHPVTVGIGGSIGLGVLCMLPILLLA